MRKYMRVHPYFYPRNDPLPSLLLSLMIDFPLHTALGLTLIGLYSISVLGLVLVVLLENRNPLKTIPWIIVLLMLPGVGLIFYVVFGQDNRRRRIISRRTYRRIMRPLRADAPRQDKCVVPPTYRPLMNMLNRNGRTPLLYGSRIDIYTRGEDKFDAFLEALRGARHHIHLQYYIFADDEIGRCVRQVLIERARAGVEVRVLYDDVGCWNVPNRFFDEMRREGIEVYAFLRVVFPLLTSKVNYRNHRKVAVIDGRTGFMGGMNIADRYVRGTAWGAWRDTHFRIEGKGVHGLQSAFLIDWYVVSRQLVKGKAYYPNEEFFDDNLMQILAGGPTGRWRVLLQAFIFCITNAKRYLYIQTPYFLPTEGLTQALQTAALGGVDVRLMLPERSDTRSANLASHSYLEDMLRAGVKVYFYRAGFLHSKLLLADDELACIGSANFDFRSFEHNFEINAFVYHRPFAERLRRMFMDDLKECMPIRASDWMRRPLPRRLIESFLRLFSPLL